MRRICAGLCMVAFCFYLAIPTTQRAQPRPASAAGAAQAHPEIMAALRSLDAARAHLNRAATVYDGHRVKAEQLTDQAIRECHAAIEYANTKHVGRVPPAPPMAQGQRKPSKGYPFIHDAINELTAARDHLQKGATDFGGHRVNALKLTNQAIAQCHAALSYVHAR